MRSALTADFVFLSALLARPLPSGAGIGEEEGKRLLSLAVFHRVTPLVFHTLLGGEALSGWTQPLAEASARHAAYNLLLLAELRRLGQLLAEVGIPFLPLKGPRLALRLRGNPGLRECFDLDLLVAPCDLPAARKILQSAGYLPQDHAPTACEDEWDRYRYEQGFHHSGLDVHCELHWRVMPGFFPFRLRAEDLLQEARPGADGMPELPGDLLAVLALAHACRHNWSLACWATDWLKMNSPSLELKALCARWGLCRMLDHGQAWSRRLEQYLVDGVSDSALAGWLNMNEPLKARATYLHYAKLLSWPDRLRLVWRLLFQPTQADLLWVKLPGGLRWLHWVLRPLRLVLQGNAR